MNASVKTLPLSIKLLLWCSCLLGTNSLADSPTQTVQISDAWVREAPPTTQVNAAYMTLTNTGKQPLTLVAARSPAFANIEFHTMALADGMMQMRQLDDLKLAAGGGQLVFRQGGQHLMLKQRKRALRVGDEIEITLGFDNGDAYTLSVPVRKH